MNSCNPEPAPHPDRRRAESGNVLFYILVAVALLGALVFAVAQGDRAAFDNLSETRTDMMASDILDYADNVSKATAQLRLRRVDFADLSFAHPDLDPAYGTFDTNPAAEIFNPGGGAIRYQSPPVPAMTTLSPWQFVATNEIDGIGTTCAADTCVDLTMLARPLTQDVCIKINETLGISNPSNAPPVESSVDDSILFSGTASYQETIGDEAGSEAVRFKSAACLSDTAAGDYVFYQVLWAR